MIFPSTNQMTGQTGIPVRRNYNDYYSRMSSMLPARVQAKNQNDYYNKMLGVQEKDQQATEDYYDNMYALNKDQAEAADNARKVGNWIQGAGAGLAGLNALDQYTDGGVKSGVKAAVTAIPSLFEKSIELPQGTNLAGVDLAGAPAKSSTWNTASGAVSDYVVDPVVSAAKDYVVDPIVSGAKDYVVDPIISGAKGLNKMFTDVTGFDIGETIGGLWS